MAGTFYIMRTSNAPDAAMPETETTTPAVEASTKFTISSDSKSTILLNIEDGVKTLLNAMAKKEEIDGVSADKYAHLPNSITGVVMHFVVEGLKNEFDLGFSQPPVSLKQRGSKLDKKVAGKKRLLTREQKNHIIEKMKMSFYELDLATGKISLDDAMTSIKAAFEEKQEFEKLGYMLPEAKTAYPHWMDESEGEE